METVKYGNEYRRTQTPGVTANYRPVLSSERAPHNDRPLLYYDN
jgi:hypothetical protein